MQIFFLLVAAIVSTMVTAYVPQFGDSKEPFGVHDQVTVDEVLRRYPYLRKNMHPDTIWWMLNQLPEGLRHRLHMVTVDVKDGKSSYHCYATVCIKGDLLASFLEKRFHSHNIGNVYFVIYVRDDLHDRVILEYLDSIGLWNQAERERLLKHYRSLVIEMPAFMWGLNLDQPLERNKFMTTEWFMTLSDSNNPYQRWQETHSKVKNAVPNYPWKDKKSVAFWRGADSGHTLDYVNVFSNITKYFPRFELLWQSHVHPDRIDAKFSLMNESFRHYLVDLGMPEKTQMESRPIEYHLNYKYLPSLDGWTAAWMRPLWIMASNSILIKQQSRKVEWFSFRLRPYVHYYPMNYDVSGLLQAMDYLDAHEEQALKIVAEANKFTDSWFSAEQMENDTCTIFRYYSRVQRQQIQIAEKDKQNEEKKAQLRKLGASNQPFDVHDRITVDEVLRRYPYLRPNLHPDVMRSMISQIPEELLARLHMVTVELKNGKSSHRCYEACLAGDTLAGFLEKRYASHNLGDAFFVMYVRDDLVDNTIIHYLNRKGFPEEEKKQLLAKYRQITIDLPAFLYSIDLDRPTERNKFLIPDRDMTLSQQWNPYRRWQIARDKMRSASTRYPWQSKQPKAFWRGVDSGHTKDDVDFFSNIAKYYPRFEILWQSHLYPEYVDAKFNAMYDVFKPKLVELGMPQKTQMEYVDLGEHLRFRYLPSLDGWTAAWIRPTAIMASNSVLIKQESRKVEWFSYLLQPKVHYYPINNDVSGLIEAILYLEAHQDEALKIVAEANKFVDKYFTPEAMEKETCDLFRDYARAQQAEIDRVAQLKKREAEITAKVQQQKEKVKEVKQVENNSHLTKIENAEGLLEIKHGN